MQFLASLGGDAKNPNQELAACRLAEVGLPDAYLKT
jgi:hypothetical protein